MYRLEISFAMGSFSVSVIGCGGTGGFVAEGLCRLLPSRAALVLIDHDRVEERNLGRQNFTQEDLGCFKSEALARRLAKRYGRPVGYSTFPVALIDLKSPGLVIGCVDNGLARGNIAEKAGNPYYARWWVDAGNGESYGQVIIGNARGLRESFYLKTGICYALPLPTIQRPELLQQAPENRDCAAIAEEQGPTINQAMAVLVVEVVRRLIEGTCAWMQLYLDLEAGTLTPVMATPEAVGRMTGISTRKLLKRFCNEERR